MSSWSSSSSLNEVHKREVLSSEHTYTRDCVARRSLCDAFQITRVVQQFMHFAVDTVATFTSTERIRYYFEVSVHCAVGY